MAKNPYTDPFYVGELNIPLSSYTPVEEKNLEHPCCPITYPSTAEANTIAEEANTLLAAILAKP